MRLALQKYWQDRIYEFQLLSSFILEIFNSFCNLSLNKQEQFT